MSTDPDQRPTPLASSPLVALASRKAANYRVLHVRVPEPIFNFAKAMALLSGMEWPEYVVKLLKQAKYPEPASPLSKEQALAREHCQVPGPDGPDKTCPVTMPAQPAKASASTTKEP